MTEQDPSVPDVAFVVTTTEGTEVAPEVKYGKQPPPSASRPAVREDPEHLKLPRKSKQDKRAPAKKRDSRQFTPAQVQVIRDTFQLFDQDRDGYVSCSDMGALLRSLGQNPTEAEIKDFINEIDADRDGRFDLRDFSQLMSSHMKGQVEMESELREAFKFFDLDGDGYVSVEELRQAMLSIGEPMTDAEANELFQICDLNKDGRIDYEEFVKVMSSDALFK